MWSGGSCREINKEQHVNSFLGQKNGQYREVEFLWITQTLSKGLKLQQNALMIQQIKSILVTETFFKLVCSSLMEGSPEKNS